MHRYRLLALAVAALLALIVLPAVMPAQVNLIPPINAKALTGPGSSSVLSQNYTISTIAGLSSGIGNGAPAANARFGIVSAVAVGPDGTVYMADAAFHQVFRVGADGHISLFAGSRMRGFGGDLGPATSATLDTPTALAVDSSGNVFIGDSGNHRVREVTIFGNIQTVAGNGQLAPSPTLSPLLPGEGGPATAAPLNEIGGLAFASNGDLVISDVGNNRIFRVSHDGNIHTVAGNATSPASVEDQPALAATLNQPTGVATDSYGNIYFAEQKTGLVRQIDARGKMTRIIGNVWTNENLVTGPWPLTYSLFSPMALVSDGWRLYVADAGRVSMYTPPGEVPATIYTIAGDVTQNSGWTGDGGLALAAGMRPTSLAISRGGGALYVADSLRTLDFHNRVRKISGSVVTAFAGGYLPADVGDNGPAVSAQLYLPQALGLDPAGNISVADTFNYRVRSIGTDGKIKTVAGTGTPGMSGDGGPAIDADLCPHDLEVGANGNLYFSDGGNIREISSNGVIDTMDELSSSPLAPSVNLTVDGQNNVYVAAMARVRKFVASTGTVSTVAGTGAAGFSGDNGPAISAQIGNVAGLTVDAAGNLYIVDAENNRVRKMNAAGTITTFAGGGTSLADGVKATEAALNAPIAATTDAMGNVYIAEYGGNRIRVIAPDGTIRTLAGNGSEGFSGDGGLATNASLNGPTDVKVDAQGNVYIADSLNSLIRRLTPGSAPPVPAVMTLLSSASLSSGPVAPGERVTLTGSALGPNGKVFFGNVASPVISSTFSSAQAVVPYEMSGAVSAQVTVTTEGIASAPFTVQIAPSAPGVFTVSGTGQGQAIAFGENGLPNSPDNPARGGSQLSVLCTGEGLVSPAASTGVAISRTPPSPVLAVSATIRGLRAEVIDAYSVPGTTGQFVVDLRVPNGVSQDNGAAILVMVGTTMTPVGATIAVREAEESNPIPEIQPEPQPQPQPEQLWYPMSRHGRLPVLNVKGR